jgi:hypothetical protein
LNAVEIEQAITRLAEQSFDAATFPYAFLEAFANKAMTLKSLKNGASNKSDVAGAVLQRNHIHISSTHKGEVSQTLDKLRASPATARQKAKFILATDGDELQAEDLINGTIVVCDYADFPNHFGAFLPLAGISTVKQINESVFDIRATSRLNQLYVELLKHNPDWGSTARSSEMNHFMARLIFCFFAEDTDIFNGDGLFTSTIEQMSDKDASNTHDVMSKIFRAMNTKISERQTANLPRWADAFPYVNGGLFSGSTEVPQFSKIARTYLLRVGHLEWQKINPDIFGSMIQAVTDEDERSALGMHYTSVPNILKVLNPLFLDDLRDKLSEAGDNKIKLLNLRKRMAKIRVFDPACGSGIFLVIAYKQMREIEFEINRRRGETHLKSEIPIKNFRGIELREFPAEVARLALIIAEYQCDVGYRGQQEALAEFLPLDSQNWILCGNALKLDWLSVCPPSGKAVNILKSDFFADEQTEIDFDNEGGETYICGNPPYLGSTWQSPEQKDDLKAIFNHRTTSWKSLDYVAGWFMKAADYGTHTPTVSAFVSTNSVCQGQQVPILWPLIFNTGHEISFAHTSFKWANLASHNAGVTVAIVGISRELGTQPRYLYSEEKMSWDSGMRGDEPKVQSPWDGAVRREAAYINAYLVAGNNVVVEKASKPINKELAEMSFGNKPVDGGHLLLTNDEVQALNLTTEQRARFIRRIYGSAEFIRGLQRYCLWIEDAHLDEAMTIEPMRQRIEGVRAMRLASRDKSANDMAARAHQMREMNIAKAHTIVVPRVSSENREFLPIGLIGKHSTVQDAAFALYDAPLWNTAQYLLFDDFKCAVVLLWAQIMNPNWTCD